MKYVCKICGYEYDEAAEAVKFADLPQTWSCPVCGVGKEMFSPVGGEEKNSPSTDSNEPKAEATLSDVLAQGLQKCGLKLVLGMVGHSNLGMGDAVRKLSEEGLLKYVGIRHEGAAAFAASAYGKLTGRPAAVLTIAGPGATNLITGLYDAKLDKSPLIALTGQVPSGKIGFYEFQEIDLHGAFKDASVAQFDMAHGADMGAVARQTWLCSTVSKGPVQIIMPDDSQTAPGGANLSEANSYETPAAYPDAGLIKLAAKKICESKSPMLILGEGARSAVEIAKEFADKFGLPVATTYRAKGLVPDFHALACGVIGLSGTAVSAHFSQKSDCILAVGVGFARHTRIPAEGKCVIRIDSDKNALRHMHIANISILSDAEKALSALGSELESLKASRRAPEAEIAEQWSAWRKEKSSRAAQGAPGTLSPAALCAVLSEKVPENAVVCADVGNATYSLGRYFESKSQRFLCSWYLGSIGVGLPSAIGACCAAAEKGSPVEGRSVFAVVGDGGLGQYLADFTTLVKYSLPAKIVVFRNSSLAKISLEQRNAKFPVWQTELVNPSFADFASSCGALGLSARTPDEAAGAIDKMLSYDGPALLEAFTDPNLS